MRGKCADVAGARAPPWRCRAPIPFMKLHASTASAAAVPAGLSLQNPGPLLFCSGPFWALLGPFGPFRALLGPRGPAGTSGPQDPKQERSGPGIRKGWAFASLITSFSLSTWAVSSTLPRRGPPARGAARLPRRGQRGVASGSRRGAPRAPTPRSWLWRAAKNRHAFATEAATRLACYLCGGVRATTFGCVAGPPRRQATG